MADSKKKLITTVKPSGLSIKRDGMKFNCSWKIGDSNYGRAQEFQFQIFHRQLVSGKWQNVGTGWIGVDVGKSTTSKSIYNGMYGTDFDPNKKAVIWMNPTGLSSPYFYSIQFRVRGRRQTEKNNGKVTKEFDWSAWNSKTLEIGLPNKPLVTVTPSDDKYNQTKYVWSLTDNKTTSNIPACIEYQSLLFKNFTYSFSDSALNKIFNDVFGTDPNKYDTKAKTYKDKLVSGKTYGYSMGGVSTKNSNNVITGYINREEDNYLFLTADYSWCRVLRVRTRGPRGWSDWLYKKKIYTKSLRAKNVNAKIFTNVSDGTTCQVVWESDTPADHPIDYTTVQFAMAVPINAKLEPDDSVSWTDGTTVGDTGSKDAAVFDIDLQLQEDQCFYVRVNNVFDKRSSKDTTTYGVPKSVTNGVGVLIDPILKNVEFPSPGSTSRLASVTVSNESGTASFGFLGIYYRNTETSKAVLLGIAEGSGDKTIDVELPEDFDSNNPGDFGVQAFVGGYGVSQSATDGEYFLTQDTKFRDDKAYYYRPASWHWYQRLTIGDAEKKLNPSALGYIYENTAPYEFYIKEAKMKSKSIIWGGKIPKPPSNLIAIAFNNSSSIAELSWNKNWKESTGTEISWADHEDAWYSTDGPSTSDVPSYQGNMWHISGLSPTKYWFRVRNYINQDGENIYGPYSETVSLKMASAPSVPVLTLSDDIIPMTGSTTCYWVYVSNDGTNQAGASIADVTYILSSDTTVNTSKSYYSYSEDTSTYARVTPELSDNPSTKGWYELSYTTIGNASTAYSYTIYPEQQDPPWQNGETHYLSVSYVSGSGEPSGWSEPVKLIIAELPNVEFISNTFELNKEIVIDGDTGEVGYIDTALTTLPFEFVVNGDDNDGIIDVFIERDEDYDIKRPDAIDENAVTTGYKNEIIAKIQAKANEITSIGYEDLIGQLDDGAKYCLKAAVKDKFGQTNKAEIPFVVYWNHQANYPDGNIQIRDDYRVAIITPTYTIGPSGATGMTGSTEASNVLYELTGDTEQLEDKTYYQKNNDIYSPIIITSGYISTLDDIYDREKSYYYSYYNNGVTSYALFELGESTDNPVTKGWYEADIDEYDVMVGYKLSEDTTIQEGKDYYWRRVIGPEEDDIEYSLVTFDAEDLEFNPQSVFLYEYGPFNPVKEGWYERNEVHDTCDIYRLSADAPELIVRGAEFGTAYVDKYPVIGSFGGYRLVYRTYTGDYITAENHIAWKEFNSEDGVILDLWDLIIDWDGKSVSLPYNVTINNSWSKDFVETKYLGGSVQGDWNPAISRTGSVSTIALVELEPDTIRLVRDLANYPGLCHVRTPDGSSYSADVQVTENREERWVGQLASIDLQITRVDSQTLDGITKEEWDKEIEAEEE